MDAIDHRSEQLPEASFMNGCLSTEPVVSAVAQRRFMRV